jgi:hypothetical protein
MGPRDGGVVGDMNARDAESFRAVQVSVKYKDDSA